MPDEQNQLEEPKVWPPPPMRPDDPINTLTVDGMMIARDGENLTVHSTRSRVMVCVLMICLATFQIAIGSNMVLRNIHDLHTHVMRFTSNFDFDIYILLLISMTASFTAITVYSGWFAYTRMRTDFLFSRSIDINFSESRHRISCPVRFVEHLEIQQKVGVMRRFYLTFYTAADIPQIGLGPIERFLRSTRRTRYITSFKTKENAERIAREIADFIGTEIERNY